MKHQSETFEAILEQIEQMIESIDPTKTIRISDITGKLKDQSRDAAQRAVS